MEPTTDVLADSEVQADLRSLARDTADRELAPSAAQWDEAEEFPVKSWEALRRAGLFAVTVGEAYDGAGLGDREAAVVLEELARADVSSAILVQLAYNGPPRGIEHLGNERLKEDLRIKSHGEGFMTVLRTVSSEPGLFLMDEPEAKLSFMSCLQLVGLLHQLGTTGAQVVCATHSPVLASTPNADIIEVGDHRFQHTEWEDLQVVDHWRRYLARPDAYRRHIIDSEGG